VSENNLGFAKFFHQIVWSPGRNSRQLWREQLELPPDRERSAFHLCT
jgi:hypothetical protein